MLHLVHSGIARQHPDLASGGSDSAAEPVTMAGLKCAADSQAQML